MIPADEMLELAKKVYPSKKFYIRNGYVYERSHKSRHDQTEYSPSLTGEDWQLAQACRVIVAAEKIPKFRGYKYSARGVAVQTGTYDLIVIGTYYQDILEAAARALLGKE